MLSRWIRQYMDHEGTGYPFKRLGSLLSEADIRFANLEAPIGTPDETLRFDKTYNFVLPPAYRQALQRGEFDVMGLANNHLLDYGPQLADSTVDYLKAMGILPVGYGANRDVAATPVIVHKAITVGFLAYSMTFPEEFWATDSTPGTAYPFPRDFVPRIRELDSRVDFTVVSFHWGAEGSDSTKQYQQEFSHRAIDAGADLVLGHHPHVWQGLETYKHRLIAYSLGNLCFGSYSPAATRSGLLEVKIGPDTIYSARIYPLNVDNVEVRFQPHLLSGARAQSFLDDVRRYSARFDSTSTLNISDQGMIRLE